MNMHTNTINYSNHVKDIISDIILTIITCGLYNLIIQNRQINSVNLMLKEEKYSFGKWFFFSLITCGAYHVYHEYIMSEDIAQVCQRSNSNDGLICLLLSIFGLSIVADAIQQNHINNYYLSQIKEIKQGRM